MKRIESALRIFIPRLNAIKGNDDTCQRLVEQYGRDGRTMPVYCGLPNQKGAAHWENFKITGSWLTADLCVEDDSFTGYSDGHKCSGRVVEAVASNWDHPWAFQVVNIKTNVPFVPGELICPEWIKGMTVDDVTAIIKKYDVPNDHARSTAEFIVSNANIGIFIDGDYRPYPIHTGGDIRQLCHVVSSKRIDHVIENIRIDQLTIGDFKEKYHNLQARRSTLVSEISTIDKELDQLRSIVEQLLK